MNDVIIVGDFFSKDPEKSTGVKIIDHIMRKDIERNKIIVQNYLFSLVVEGSKIVHTGHQSMTLGNDKFPLFLSGNYLMTEKIASPAGRFQSLLLFFNQEALNLFFAKHADIRISSVYKPVEKVHVFDKDPFTKNFIESLQLMFKEDEEIPASLQQLKFEELMLYLCHHYPDKVQPLRSRAIVNLGEIEFKKLVESNIGDNVSLEELAFLCHMSLSTFKRKFIRLYGMPPSKWFLKRRMELATVLLKAGREKPGEIYHKVGYESHSSFTHSFKQIFGVTPSQYQEKTLA